VNGRIQILICFYRRKKQEERKGSREWINKEEHENALKNVLNKNKEKQLD
jgi:hypothetical protein